ncbi:intercellular trafficking and secretion [Apophysomyces ossiformis]|uniref:Sorting nexin-4 n=1 Tax=Apophysomyces ossiformis TaxID=679940 RepID=A0A8H7BKX2_9FUNG|nr:intercellular trafficking and secretion [Apophysomyces ossiformis]
MKYSNEFDNVDWDIQDGTDQHNDHSVADPLSEIDGPFNHIAINSDEPNANGIHARPATPPARVEVDLSDDTRGPSQPAIFHHVSQAESSSSSTSMAEWKRVKVIQPQKENDSQNGTFVSYLIQSDVTKTSVRRRFQDFVWLYNVLYTHYPACFVPPLPDKHRMEYVKGDRFGADFIEKRRVSLERFLQRIARHPILGRAEFFLMFLESSEFNDASARALREGQETIIDTIGDSLLNAFAKIRKPDERFVEMKGRIERLEENLELLEKTLMRTSKRKHELCRDYDEFANSIRGLAQLETTLEEPLVKFATGVDRYSSNMRTMLTHDSNWISEIHDYLAYYNVLKGVLKLRDQKQLDFEELSDYQQYTLKERERTLYPRASDKGYNIAGFFTGKINEVRGADVDKIKREKVLRLDERIRELQSAIEQTHDVSVAFSNQVAKEDEFFTRSKEIEMSDALKSYTDSKVTFYEEGIHLWREVVQALEQVNTENH